VAWELPQVIKGVLYGLPVEVTSKTYVRVSRVEFPEPGSMAVVWSVYPNKATWEAVSRPGMESGSFRVVFKKDAQPIGEPLMDPVNGKVLEPARPAVPSLEELFLLIPALKPAIEAMKKALYETSTAVVLELGDAKAV